VREDPLYGYGGFGLVDVRPLEGKYLADARPEIAYEEDDEVS
jgi:hypothetical protein